MLKINDIGLQLLKSINKNDSDNKKIFILKLNEYNKNKKKDEDKFAEDFKFYLDNYENKRKMNDTLYGEYLQKRFPLYKKWLESKKKPDLENLFKLKNINYVPVPDIYTKTKPNSLLK
jgi:hypothetical protein